MMESFQRVSNIIVYSFKERVILLCQSILETSQISHLHGSALFTIALKTSITS